MYIGMGAQGRAGGCMVELGGVIHVYRYGGTG